MIKFGTGYIVYETLDELLAAPQGLELKDGSTITEDNDNYYFNTPVCDPHGDHYVWVVDKITGRASSMHWIMYIININDKAKPVTKEEIIKRRKNKSKGSV